MARTGSKSGRGRTARTPARRAAPARKAAPRRAPGRGNGAVGAAALERAQGRVLGWFEEHHRRFPWRETRDPYRTLVAETMLQQTQTGRVAPTYEKFIREFPSLDALAHAPAMQVIRAWRGLGYNRRAVDLHEAAQALVHDHGGVFPRDVRALRRLPGVGEYTAKAVACFALGEEVPVVDTNVRRVLARAALGMDAERTSPRRVGAVAEAWLPAGEAYRWNQAIMDLGAMVCRVEHPLCPRCPLRAACRYHAMGRHKRPRPRASKGAERFEGSRRQKRGSIVDHLRDAARDGLTMATLARALHPEGGDRDLDWLAELVVGLERDGLVRLTPAARRGSPRGVVRLPG